MSDKMLLYMADALLVIHALFVCFVILGLICIYLGYVRQWAWVRNRIFRILHLLAIGIVVIQSWLGIICPLTVWEMELREAAGAVSYSGSFIQYWLHRLLYFRAPEWVFITIYTCFGASVAGSWFLVRPYKA